MDKRKMTFRQVIDTGIINSDTDLTVIGYKFRKMTGKITEEHMKEPELLEMNVENICAHISKNSATFLLKK